ncbi:MAG: hypothetical protein N3A66_11740, partial [Planctomycetota bacterium]|nr:hypothetical protein [Planctomycetota bacterium]
SRIFIHDAVMIACEPCMEVYIQPPLKPGGIPEYFQFLGNARGCTWDCHFMPTIGQGITGWDGHFEYRTSIGAEAWVSEVSVPFADFGIAAADIKDGFAFKLDVCRDGGCGPEALSYLWAFHDYGRHMPATLSANAPAIHVLNFGDFSERKFNPQVEIYSPDRDADVMAIFEILSEAPDPQTGEHKILAAAEANAAVGKGQKQTLAADLPLADGQKGLARLTVKEKNGAVLLRRTWPFQAKAVPPADFKPTPIKKFNLSAYWAPSLGKVHVLADVFELKDCRPSRVAVEVYGPEGEILGRGEVDKFQYGGGAVDIDLRGGRLRQGKYLVRAKVNDESGREVAQEEISYERKVYDLSLIHI